MADNLPVFPSITMPPSLKEMAYEAIKESIVTNRLVPGSIYTEQAIARELGISKTPVREALISLASRGFVTILPRKGFQVSHLTDRQIREIFEFRHALERAVILNVALSVTGSAIADIESINSKAAKAKDRKSFLKCDRDFHRYLASLTQNRYITDALENIWDLCDWVAAVVYLLKGRPQEAVQEHASLIEKLKKGDPEGAAAAMEEHLRITEMRFLSRAKPESD